MSLLFVTIKSGQLQGCGEDVHSYVILKLQNVKSTTIPVRGNRPTWEQEFIFETDLIDQGLIIELWNKGVLWDKLLGVYYLDLKTVPYSQSHVKWLQINEEFETRNGEVVGTVLPSGHSLLVDCRFELPSGFENDDGCQYYSPQELHDLNNSQRFLEEDRTLIEESIKRQLNRSGVSEDSDYTSDIAFPTGYHPTNSSIHQFESFLHPYNGHSNTISSRQQHFNGHQSAEAEQQELRDNWNASACNDELVPSSSMHQFANKHGKVSTSSQQKDFSTNYLLMHSSPSQQHISQNFDDSTFLTSPKRQYDEAIFQQYSDDAEVPNSVRHSSVEYTREFVHSPPAGGYNDLGENEREVDTFPHSDEYSQYFQANTRANPSSYNFAPNFEPSLQSQQQYQPSDSELSASCSHQGLSGTRYAMDSRSSNSSATVVANNYNRAPRFSCGGVDSESDGFTSTGTVVKTSAGGKSRKHQKRGHRNKPQNINSEWNREKEINTMEFDENYEANLIATGRRYDSRPMLCRDANGPFPMGLNHSEIHSQTAFYHTPTNFVAEDEVNEDEDQEFPLSYNSRQMPGTSFQQQQQSGKLFNVNSIDHFDEYGDIDTRREYETYGLEYINSNDGNYSSNFLPLHNNECSPVKSEIYHEKPSQQEHKWVTDNETPVPTFEDRIPTDRFDTPNQHRRLSDVGRPSSRTEATEQPSELMEGKRAARDYKSETGDCDK